MSSSCRKGKGRQKVEMVKIENEANLQVTFSKRRAGLFKKASELSSLCGAETAVVVFSPGNKAHCFGHPSVDAVATRFLSLQADGVAPVTDADKLVEAHRKATVNQHNLELARIQKELEFEQERRRELERERKEMNMDKLNYQQLGRLKGELLRLKHRLQTPPSTVPYDPTAANESCPIIPYSSN